MTVLRAHMDSQTPDSVPPPPRLRTTAISDALMLLNGEKPLLFVADRSRRVRWLNLFLLRKVTLGTMKSRQRFKYALFSAATSLTFITNTNGNGFPSFKRDGIAALTYKLHIHSLALRFICVNI